MAHWLLTHCKTNVIKHIIHASMSRRTVGLCFRWHNRAVELLPFTTYNSDMIRWHCNRLTVEHADNQPVLSLSIE